MGSLAIEDPPTMEEQVLAPLHSLETSFNSLLTSLTTTPSYSNAPSATQSLLLADDALTTALQALYTHQKNYARILQLRAEAERLEQQIKSTIRTCVDLRKEIGNIHPSILSPDSDSSSTSSEADATEQHPKDIDYHTLLSFASKIGKHNTAAAKEAEDESTRRLIQARKEKEKLDAMTVEANINGTNTPVPAAGAIANIEATPAPAAANGEAASQTLIPQHERDWLDAEAAMARARTGMAFPAAENLRKGALGRLQWIREQQQGAEGGEAAVEREVETMIAQAEGRSVPARLDDGAEPGAQMLEVGMPAAGAGAQQRLPLPGTSQTQQVARPAPPPPQEKKKSVVALDLDLWNEDDEDDD